jgi:hypothetical protein
MPVASGWPAPSWFHDIFVHSSLNTAPCDLFPVRRNSCRSHAQFNAFHVLQDSRVYLLTSVEVRAIVDWRETADLRTLLANLSFAPSSRLSGGHGVITYVDECDPLLRCRNIRTPTTPASTTEGCMESTVGSCRNLVVMKLYERSTPSMECTDSKWCTPSSSRDDKRTRLTGRCLGSIEWKLGSSTRTILRNHD